MEEVITYTDYQQYKEAVDKQWRENEETAGELVEGFAVIGYLLKQARDTDILRNSGYKNVNEFAEAEYHIDKTVVSRYMGINDRFSEMGNSKQLKEHYRGIGYAKLLLMMQMPDEINEEITPAFSKSEIQKIKDEVDKEKRSTELEVMMEGEEERQQAMEDNLKKAVHQLGRDNPELYAALHLALKEERTIDAIADVLAPAGERIYSIRIQGIGRLMLSVKGTDRDVSLSNIRTNEKEFYSWTQMAEDFRKLMNMKKSAEESWEETYGEEYPKAPEPKVAPVQPSHDSRKPAAKKQSKVVKAKTAPEKPKTVQEPPVATGTEEESDWPEAATVQQDTEASKEEEQEDVGEEDTLPSDTEDEEICRLRQEAGTCIEKVKEGLENNQYHEARENTKCLLDLMNEIWLCWTRGRGN